ncbi:MAG: hypothetical protein ACLTR6_05155 [Clostridium fessum]
MRKVRYDSAFTFIYSKRTGTPAAAMENQVPEEVVKERFDRLLAEVQAISAQVCGRDVHTVQESSGGGTGQSRGGTGNRTYVQ